MNLRSIRQELLLIGVVLSIVSCMACQSVVADPGDLLGADEVLLIPKPQGISQLNIGANDLAAIPPDFLFPGSPEVMDVVETCDNRDHDCDGVSDVDDDNDGVGDGTLVNVFETSDPLRFEAELLLHTARSRDPLEVDVAVWRKQHLGQCVFPKQGGWYV